MRIVVDLQGAQAEHRHRGIGKYSISLAKALCRAAGSADEIIIALNGSLPESIDTIRREFSALSRSPRIAVWHAPPATLALERANAVREKAAALVREAFFASLEPDVVLVTSLFEGLVDNASTGVSALTRRVPTAVVHFGLQPIRREPCRQHPAVAEWYEGRLSHLRRADLLLTLSDASRDEAISQLGIPEDCIETIFAATDPPAVVQAVPADAAPALLDRHGIRYRFLMYVGGVARHKNIERLIAAYALLAQRLRSGFQLVIVCTLAPENRTKLTSLALSHGLAPSEVVFTGRVSAHELQLLYGLCHAFVFPSLHEAFATPCLEALARGKAVIASDCSSLPEIIERSDARFDPCRPDSMAAAMRRLMVDQGFRAGLERDAARLASKFSWERTAALAIGALRNLAKPTLDAASAPAGARPRLAHVSPLPPHASATSAYSTQLLPELARHYDIEVVVTGGQVDDPRVTANCTVRSVEWFMEHAARFDRVVYHLGDSMLHAHMIDLLQVVPGAVVLHDFSLSSLIAGLDLDVRDDGSWAEALYASHGYRALRDRFAAADPAAVIAAYPCNVDILRHALGVIVHSATYCDLACQWYGPGAARDWSVIGLPPAVEDDMTSKETLPPHGPVEQAGQGGADSTRRSLRAHADEYAAALEALYGRADVRMAGVAERLSRLVPDDWDDGDYSRFAAALAASVPPSPRQRQLFVDVSELVQRDGGSGIQRVVKKILTALIDEPPAGYRVEPVYATTAQGYRYARKFMLDVVGARGVTLPDDTIDHFAEDIFLGLDLHPQIVVAREADFRQMRRNGVKVHFVVYDLLPITLPQAFVENAAAAHEAWLRTVSATDSLICISRSVADEVCDWLEASGVEREGALRVSWFHLGSDDVLGDRPAARTASRIDPRELAALSQAPSFLMVGTVEPRKGHQQTLLAFEEMWSNDLDVNLVIVGKAGWKVEGLTEALRAHPERGRRLFWYEAANDTDLELLYRTCLCLIAPSLAEGFGLPLIEAARRGLPLLCRDIPPFREVAGPHATYFAGESAQSLVDAIAQWLTLKLSSTVPDSAAMAVATWPESARELVERLMGRGDARHGPPPVPGSGALA